MRRFALAVALACVLSGVARAGEIPTSGVTSPTEGTVTVAGEIPTTGGTAPSTPGTAPGDVPTNGGTQAEDSSTVLTIILTFIGIVS